MKEDKYAALLNVEPQEQQTFDVPLQSPVPSGLPWEGYYYSSYGLAVKRGYKGTEEEWLASLKGDRGVTGAVLVSQEKTGEDADGNYIYTQTFDDGSTAEFKTPKGNQGEQGVSPTVSVSLIVGGHRVTITDKNGSHSFDVMDGVGLVDVDTEAAMDALLIPTNLGKMYLYTGVNGKYQNGNIYIVQEGEP